MLMWVSCSARLSKNVHTLILYPSYNDAMQTSRPDDATSQHGGIDTAMPIISVSGSEPLSYGTAAIITQLKSQGVYPVMLDHNCDRVPEYLDRLDGVVVMGNRNDIDPQDYGQTRQDGTVVPDTQDYRDRMAFESALVEGTLKRGVPLLGVCGGMQRMNVGGALGERGTLRQHLPESEGKFFDQHMRLDMPYTPIHFVKMLKGTRLAEIAENVPGYFAPVHTKLPHGIIMENSLHHQGIGALRKGFRPSAITKDGLIEAMEPDPNGPYAGQFALGLQWHPEFGTSPVSQRIVQVFASETQRYKRQEGTAHTSLPEWVIPKCSLASLAMHPPEISRLFDGVGPLTQQR